MTGTLKKVVATLKAKVQVFDKIGKTFDFTFDLCEIFKKKNNGDIFTRFTQDTLKAIKGLELKCPIEPVS